MLKRRRARPAARSSAQPPRSPAVIEFKKRAGAHTDLKVPDSQGRRATAAPLLAPKTGISGAFFFFFF